MNVSFVNKYTVEREGHAPYHHLKPEMRARASQPGSQDTSDVPRGARANNVARILGLALAICIVIISILGRMPVFLVIGAILACMYVLRIRQSRLDMRASKQESVQEQAARRAEEDLDTGGKWVRYVRFGDYIQVEDPGIQKDYQYSQIERISDDAAYITLWMDNGSQVRVAKNGFTIGTLQGFEQFIMSKTHRLIGPAASDA